MTGVQSAVAGDPHHWTAMDEESNDGAEGLIANRRCHHIKLPGSVQNLSHFGSCDGGSMGLKFHLV